MADALAAVKKDLGRNAVILHTRQIKSGGLLGFRRRTLIEITASDQAPKGGRKAAPVAMPGRAERSGTGTIVGVAGAARGSAGVNSPGVAAAPLLAAMAANAYRQSASQPGRTADRVTPGPDSSATTNSATANPAPGSASIEVKSQAMPRTAPSTPEHPSSTVMTVRQRRAGESGASLAGGEAHTSPVRHDKLFAELADIKLLVNQVLQTSPAAIAPGVAAGAMPEALFKHYLRLLEASVSRDITDSIIGLVRDELSPSELSDESIVRSTILRHLAGLIPVAEQTSRGRGDDGRPLTIALVGPTGVGKTTTIAKLAAAYKLRQGRSVGLITSDTYRIAAVDQLRTYASILGVPLKVVTSPEEMDAAVRSMANFDVVLIDSAGRSQNATERLRELAAFLHAASPHETHLVLSSTASEGVLVKAAESFIAAGVIPNRLILSKLDEAVNFGVVVNVARRLSAKLSFVTTGQEVPDHIEPGRPDRLARMILDNTMTAPAPTRLAASRAARPHVDVDGARAELVGAEIGAGQ